MKRIVCEMCGSHELVKEDGLFVCPYCGCKYTLEEARKMMIEGNVDVSGSTVKIDDSKELENLYRLARRARSEHDSSAVIEYYSKILLKDPNSWEAYFYSVYYKTLKGNHNSFNSKVVDFNNSFSTLLGLVENHVSDCNERYKIHLHIIEDSENLLVDLIAFNKKHYTPEKCKSTSAKELESLQYGSRTYILAMAIRQYANYVEYVAEKYDKGLEKAVVRLLKVSINAIDIVNKLPNIIDASKVADFPTKEERIELVNYCTEKIRKYEPDFETKVAPGACYVATAVYGSYDCPQVWTLRRFRDYTLAESILGRAFIKTYYAISPTVVKYFGDTVWFNKLFRGVLNKMVAKLNETGVEDTPYEDRVW